jgi:glycosyltransferase involved in cell wall biosynthesis
LKILLVISSLAAGGAQRVMVDLGAWLVERGHDVTLLTYSDPVLDHFHEPPGVRRVALRLLWDSTGPFDMLASNIRRLRTMRAAIRGLRPDVIVSFIDITNVLTLLSSLGLGVPVIISERIHPSYHPIGLRWRLLRRLTYPLSSALVVQTQAIATWARATVAARRIRIIPNPLPSRAWPAGAAREPIVLGVGRLHRQKGFDLLVDAFAKSCLPMEWRLVLIGEGPERAALAARVEALGLQDRVEMPGEVPDPEAWLARASMFVLSSRYEGFPNVVLEAMACRTPVLAFDCPTGPRDILGHGSGIVLPPEDVDALARGIRSLAGNPWQRDSLAQTASRALAQFAPERINALWLDLMHSVGRRADTVRGEDA